jgi:hypothetical protein
MSTAISGLIFSIIAAMVMSAITSALTFRARDTAGPAREKAIRFAAILPLVYVVWFMAILASQMLIDDALLGQHTAMGARPVAPLPNGYVIEMTAKTQGAVYDPKTRSADTYRTGFVKHPDEVDAVRLLQVEGPLVFGRSSGMFGTIDLGALGEADPDVFGRFNTPFLGSYFILDTRTGTHREYARMDQFRAAVAAPGLRIRLERIEDVYASYRATWFDVVAQLLYVFPPLIAVILLMRAIALVRRMIPPPEPVPQPSLKRVRDAAAYYRR